MAVLTEAIEAERGAGAATVTGTVGLVATAMAMTTAQMGTSTGEGAALALDLAPLMTIATTVLRVVLVEMSGMMIVVRAVIANAALAVTRALSSMKMNATVALSSCSSLPPA
jgi:hypothetical protein